MRPFLEARLPQELLFDLSLRVLSTSPWCHQLPLLINAPLNICCIVNQPIQSLGPTSTSLDAQEHPLSHQGTSPFPPPSCSRIT